MATIDYNEDSFYNAEFVQSVCGLIGVGATDALKYICSNFTLKANEADYKYFLDTELMEQFQSLRYDCLDFIKAFDYYYPKAVETNALNSAALQSKIYGDKVLNVYYSKEQNLYHSVLEERESDIPLPATDLVLVAKFRNGEKVG